MTAEGEGGAAAIVAACSAAQDALAADLAGVLAAPDGTAAGAVPPLQTAAVKALLQRIAGLTAAAPAAAAAFAPSQRFLGQAVERMASPASPDPALVAARVLGSQPQVADWGMLAGGLSSVQSTGKG